ncbi:hypothetical protein [Providencia stuartii]|uniref:hypothetical protein n=1 Tax=Providencia stuartii TaxID=588 RepID=UPI00111E37AD|nr:hypothetical protein [Providencia stuartii]
MPISNPIIIKIIDPSRTISDTKTYLIELSNKSLYTKPIKITHNLDRVHNINLHFKICDHGKKAITVPLSNNHLIQDIDNQLKTINQTIQTGTKQAAQTELSKINVAQHNIETQTQAATEQAAQTELSKINVAQHNIETQTQAATEQAAQTELSKINVAQHNIETQTQTATEQAAQTELSKINVAQHSVETQTQTATEQAAQTELSKINVAQHNIETQTQAAIEQAAQTELSKINVAQHNIETQTQTATEQAVQTEQSKINVAQHNIETQTQAATEHAAQTEQSKINVTQHSVETQTQTAIEQAVQTEQSKINAAQRTAETQTKSDKIDSHLSFTDDFSYEDKYEKDIGTLPEYDENFSSDEEDSFTASNSSINKKKLKSSYLEKSILINELDKIIEQLQDKNISDNKFYYLYSTLAKKLQTLNLETIVPQKLRSIEELYDYILIEQLNIRYDKIVSSRYLLSVKEPVSYKSIYDAITELHYLGKTLFKLTSTDEAKIKHLNNLNIFLKYREKMRSVSNEKAVILDLKSAQVNKIDSNKILLTKNTTHHFNTYYDDLMDFINYINECNSSPKELTKEEKEQDKVNIIKLALEQLKKYNLEDIVTTENKRKEIIQMLNDAIDNAHARGIIITKIKQKIESNISRLNTTEINKAVTLASPKMTSIQSNEKTTTTFQDKIKSPSKSENVIAVNTTKKHLKNKNTKIILNQERENELRVINGRQLSNNLKRLSEQEYLILKIIREVTLSEILGENEDENKFIIKIKELGKVSNISVNIEEHKILKQLSSLPFYQNKITTYLKKSSSMGESLKTNSSKRESKDNKNKEKRGKDAEEE